MKAFLLKLICEYGVVIFPQKLLNPVPRLLLSYFLGCSVFKCVKVGSVLCSTCNQDEISLDLLENNQRKKMHLDLCTEAAVRPVYATGSIKANSDWPFVAPLLLFFQCVPCQMQVTFISSCQCWFATADSKSIKTRWYFLCPSSLECRGAWRSCHVRNYIGSWYRALGVFRG